MPRVYPNAPESRSSPTYSKGSYAGDSCHANTSWQKATGYVVDTGRSYVNGSAFAMLPGVRATTCVTKAAVGLSPDTLLRNVGRGRALPVQPEELSGVSVALFFSLDSSPRCRCFLPFLNRFYTAVNQGAASRKVEVILVSMDETKQEFIAQCEKTLFTCVAFESPVRKRLIAEFGLETVSKITAPSDPPLLGIPRLEVIGSDGTVLQSLDSDGGDPWMSLSRWDYAAHKWPGEPLNLTTPLAIMGREGAYAKETEFADENVLSPKQRHGKR